MLYLSKFCDKLGQWYDIGIRYTDDAEFIFLHTVCMYDSEFFTEKSFYREYVFKGTKHILQESVNTISTCDYDAYTKEALIRFKTLMKVFL